MSVTLISPLVLTTLGYSVCHYFGGGHVTFHFPCKKSLSPWVQHLCQALQGAERYDGVSMGDSYSLSHVMPAKMSPHFLPAVLVRIVPALERL